MEGGAPVSLLQTPALPATCPPQGLAVMERVLATTNVTCRSTEEEVELLVRQTHELMLEECPLPR